MALGKRQLNQNEEAIVKIIYHTAKRPGDYKKRIYITTDIPDSPPIIITIAGTVHAVPVPKIEVEPRKINVGIIERTAIESLSVKVSNPGDKPLEIKTISKILGESCFHDRKAGDLTIAPKKSEMVEIAFSTDVAGPFVEVVFVESNARRDRYAIMVLGEAR